jgi:hypothetical protein
MWGTITLLMGLMGMVRCFLWDSEIREATHFLRIENLSFLVLSPEACHPGDKPRQPRS